MLGWSNKVNKASDAMAAFRRDFPLGGAPDAVSGHNASAIFICRQNSGVRDSL